MSYKNVAGIYKITCIAEGSFKDEVYYGQAYCFETRKQSHVSRLKTGTHINRILQNIYNSKSDELEFEEIFEFNIVKALSGEFRDNFAKEEVRKVLTKMEQCYLTAFNCKMNICKVAGTTLGTVRDDDAIENVRNGRLKGEHLDVILYHAKHGWLHIENLGFYIRDNNLDSRLYRVLRETTYCYRDHYKSEEYYLSKAKWDEDHPIPQSRYEGVCWCRKYERWVSRFKKYYFGLFESEEDAAEAIEKFKAENPELVKEQIIKVCAEKYEPFELFNSNKGVIEKGDYLYSFCEANELRYQSIKKVINGVNLQSDGYYKLEEYYLDKKAWHQDYPLPVSWFPGVWWSRSRNRWCADGRINNKFDKRLGAYKTEAEAIAAVKAYHKEKGITVRSQAFTLFSLKDGVVSGEYLIDYAKKNGLCSSGLYDVLYGRLYKSQGHYLTEEYYLDKNKWLNDHPLPASKYPHVVWDRRKDKWKAYYNVKVTKGKWRQKNLGNHDDDYEAYRAVLDYKASLGLDEAC